MRPMDEAVDGHDAKIGVGMQDAVPHLQGVGLGGFKIQFGFSHGQIHDGICARVDVAVQALDDAALHLGRRLVGKGDGQNARVLTGIGQTQREIGLDQGKGLARSGRGCIEVEQAVSALMGGMPTR